MPLPYGFTAKGKIDFWIRNQKSGTRFSAQTLHKEVLLSSVSRSTVNSHLREFAANGHIEKSTVSVGRNQTWIIK